MTSWFRSWHGAPTDSKWLVIAKRANVAPGMVSAVFWALLDTASQAEERGSVTGFDPEAYALWAGWEETDVQAVIVAMKAKGVIGADDRLTAWDKRQPKREDDSSDRVRQHRERQKTQQNTPNADVTHGNAAKRSVTHGNNTDTDTDTEKEGTQPRPSPAAPNGVVPSTPTPQPSANTPPPLSPDAAKYGAFVTMLEQVFAVTISPALGDFVAEWVNAVTEQEWVYALGECKAHRNGFVPKYVGSILRRVTAERLTPMAPLPAAVVNVKPPEVEAWPI